VSRGKTDERSEMPFAGQIRAGPPRTSASPGDACAAAVRPCIRLILPLVPTAWQTLFPKQLARLSYNIIFMSLGITLNAISASLNLQYPSAVDTTL